MKRLALAISACLLVLTGCSGATTGASSPGDGAASEPVDAPSQSASPKKAEPEEDDGPAKIGDKYTYSDGIAVEIIRVKTAKVPKGAAGGKPGDPMVILSIRVTNKTKSNMDASLASAQVTFGKDGEQAEQVYHTGMYGFSGTILKGRAQTAKLGYDIPKKQMGDVTVEFTPDFEHEAAIFAGSVK